MIKAMITAINLTCEVKHYLACGQTLNPFIMQLFFLF